MLGGAHRKKWEEKREGASETVLLADDFLHGRLPRGLLAIDGKKKKREGNSKGAGLERLAEAASR